MTTTRDEPPLRGGLFQWLSRRLGRWAGVSVPVVEEIWGPSRHQARVEVERRREAGDPAPSPGDPPAEP